MNATDNEEKEAAAKAEDMEAAGEAVAETAEGAAQAQDDAAGESAPADGQASDDKGGEAAPAEGEAPAEDAAEKPAEDEAAEAKPEEKPEEKKPAGPDWKDLYARTLADFENFRKRTERDREDLAKFAAKEILKDLLATADNLALALEKAKDKDEPFVKGVQLVYDGFLKVLADHGATPLDSVGEPFDTAFHEALTQQPSDTVPEGHVMTEFKRGWLLNGKLLRAAQVVVSSGKPE